MTCGHGFTVPFGQNPMTWCYNHMGIGEGSSFGAFFTNTADEFDLIGLAFAAGNKGTYYYPCPYGDCGYKTQPIWVPAYSPAAISDLLNAILVLPNGVAYQPGRGLNSTNADENLPPRDWGYDFSDKQACEARVLDQEYGPAASPMVASFSLYSYLPDSPYVAQAWTTVAESVTVKGGILGLAYLVGGQAVKAAGAYVAERAVPLASTVLTGAATVMNLRARYVCGEGL